MNKVKSACQCRIAFGIWEVAYEAIYCFAAEFVSVVDVRLWHSSGPRTETPLYRGQSQGSGTAEIIRSEQLRFSLSIRGFFRPGAGRTGGEGKRVGKLAAAGNGKSCFGYRSQYQHQHQHIPASEH